MFLLSENLFYHDRSRFSVGVRHTQTQTKLCSVLSGFLTDSSPTDKWAIRQSPENVMQVQ